MSTLTLFDLRVPQDTAAGALAILRTSVKILDLTSRDAVWLHWDEGGYKIASDPFDPSLDIRITRPHALWAVSHLWGELCSQT